jgi:hypothetical protein
MTTRTIQILYPTEIAGKTTLKPGTYRVRLDAASHSPTLDFYQNSKQIAEAPVKLVPSESKISETEIRYHTVNNAHLITEIDFRGSRQRIMLENGTRQP